MWAQRTSFFGSDRFATAEMRMFAICVDRWVELNVKEQVFNLCTTSIVQNAWKNGQDLAVHGMVINIGTGELVNQNCTFDSNNDLDNVFAYQ